MRIVHINLSYSSGFGYTENMLPKAFADFGNDVHIITTNTQIYWYDKVMYNEVYEERLGPAITAVHTFEENGVIIHRLPYFLFCPFKSQFHQFEQYGIQGIYQILERIKPDIIQCQEINLYSTFYAARYAKKNGIKLFTENHIHKSVFKPRNRFLKSLYNSINPFLRIINSQTSLCFPIAKDAEELCFDYYKLSKNKVKLQSLGVDTGLFKFINRENRNSSLSELRKELGFDLDDIVVIYTGRFTDQKNPLCLAKAINLLRTKGFNKFKGLFIGKGSKDYESAILNCRGCRINDFVSVDELPAFYGVADIGVWPAQESMSQLDALSTGLPLILSDTIEVFERIENNGFLYKDNDESDLADQLLKLADPITRLKFGLFGSKKVLDSFSWKAIAEERLNDFLSE
jgi:glycosyltransferase involved in cell wall biosynthesis